MSRHSKCGRGLRAPTRGRAKAAPTLGLHLLQPKHYGIDVPSSKWKRKLLKQCRSAPSKKTCAFSLFFVSSRSRFQKQPPPIPPRTWPASLFLTTSTPPSPQKENRKARTAPP